MNKLMAQYWLTPVGNEFNEQQFENMIPVIKMGDHKNIYYDTDQKCGWSVVNTPSNDEIQIIIMFNRANYCYYETLKIIASIKLNNRDAALIFDGSDNNRYALYTEMEVQ